MKKIYLGADHAGFQLKEKLKKWLKREKIAYEDLGNLKYDKNDDFPDYAFKVARQVAKKQATGILICGTGQGMCIAANKVRGIIASLSWNFNSAKHAKEHDNANILCLGAEFVNEKQAQQMIKVWLNSKFNNAQKYSRRLNKIKRLENAK